MGSKRASELANLRRATQGARRTLRQFERAAAQVQKKAIAAAQVEGKRAHLAMARRYLQEQYANAAGAEVRIKNYGAAWRARKARLGLRMERGQARRGVYKQVRSPLGFVKIERGFTIDLERPGLTVTGRATLSSATRTINTTRNNRLGVLGFVIKKTNRRSFYVNDYLAFFSAAKAPGLGSITQNERRAINDAARQAVTRHIQGITNAATLQLSKDAAARIVVRLA
jgi:hypothetical protein